MEPPCRTMTDMGARGPAPEPRRLQAIKGRGGTKRQNGKPLTNQPTVVTAIPPKPQGLGSHGSKLWDLVTPELERMGVMGRIDRTELECYCRLYDEWKRTDPKDRRWLSMIERMSRLACNLGCSPSARLRMELPEPVLDEKHAIFGG